jgi:hypothetical protein
VPQNTYLRALLSFLGAALVASLLVVAIGSHSHSSTAAPVHSASAPVKVPILETAEERPQAEPEPIAPPVNEASRPPAVSEDTADPSQPTSIPPRTESVPATKPLDPPPLPAPQVTQPDPVVASTPPPPAVTSAPPPTIVNSVVLGVGTPLLVRLQETLSTTTSRTGQTFTGVLEDPIVVNGFVVAERGARVEGRVARAEPARRIHGLARLTVVLTSLNTSDGQHLTLNSYPLDVEGQNIVGVQGLKNGASTTVGTVVGAVAGRASGSAIGSLVGGVIGTSGALLTGGKPAVLSTRQPLSFRLRDPISITERNSSVAER